MYTETAAENFGSFILPCQYNELIRRPSRLEGEKRLMWAVLEDAIRTHLVNRKCATRNQRIAYEQTRRWFEAPAGVSSGLFGFRTICDVLDIDAARLLAGLKITRAADLPRHRHHRVLRSRKVRQMAA